MEGSRTQTCIAICGGGISGLCLAVCLSRHPHLKVDLYESANEFKEIGAGVTVWGRTWQLLKLIGLSDDLGKLCHPPPKDESTICFEFRRSDSAESGSTFQVVELPYGGINFYRAEFLDVFVKHLPPGIAHFGKRLTSYKQNETDNGPVQLHFADGTKASCDMLVGTDGIKSTIRAQMYGEMYGRTGEERFLGLIPPVWTGSVAFRGLVDASKIPSDHRTTQRPVMYCGKDKHIVSYSIARGGVVNVVAFSSSSNRAGEVLKGDWVTESSQEELLEAFKNWEPEVISLLGGIQSPTKWAIHQVQALPAYCDNRVVLIGDAAHAMSPHLGVGAGQAIEDAYVLSRLLGSMAKHDVRDILKAFETARLHHTQTISEAAFETGAMFEFNGPQGDNLPELGRALQDKWSWMYTFGMDDVLDAPSAS